MLNDLSWVQKFDDDVAICLPARPALFAVPGTTKRSEGVGVCVCVYVFSGCP
jgi:hypothetical protein